MDPMWKILMKDVDLEELTSFRDHVYLGCTQRDCQTSKDNVDNYRNMFGSNVSAGAMEKSGDQFVQTSLIEFAIKSANKLVIEPPVTAGLSFCSLASMMSLTSLFYTAMSSPQ